MAIVPNRLPQRPDQRGELVRELYALADRVPQTQARLLWVYEVDIDKALRVLDLALINAAIVEPCGFVIVDDRLDDYAALLAAEGY